MKEYIYTISASAGRTITLTGFTETTLSKDNVLGIVNETTAKVLFSPLKSANVTSVTYSNGTLTITLADSVTALAANDKLFIKIYSSDEPEDPYSQALAAFFNITPPVPNAVPMTQQEVEDDLDELWNLIITQ